MKALLIQVVSAVILGIGFMQLGISLAWPSSTLLLFKSENTTLDRPMSEGEASLFGSLSAIGGMIGNPLMAFLLGKIGRKYTTILSVSMSLIGWTMIVFTKRVEIVLTAIFIFGINGSVYMIIPLYISELCQENIRGTMTSFAFVFNGLGMLVSILLGSVLSYNTMTYVFLVMSGVAVGLLWILKESPVLLMQRQKEDEAKKSVAFYRCCDPNSKEVMQEIEKIKRAFNRDGDELLLPVKPPSFIQLFKKSRSTRRALIIMLMLVTSANFQGIIVVLVYSIPLFAQVIPADVMSPALCSMLLCAINMASSLLSGLLTDKAGRRMLMMVASFLTGVFSVTVGSLIIFEWGPKWLIAVFIYLYCITFTLGAGTVPFIMIAEVFLPEVKGYMTMVLTEWSWFCNFILLFAFQPIISEYGIGPVFFFFAVVSFLASVYSMFFIPETRGLSVDVIQTLFLKKRKDVETVD